ncbi:MAG: M23 family metallopeptidase [Hymenobacter sp.]
MRAAFDGVIRISKWDGGGYGNYLLVRHYNGLETLYGHLSKPSVPVGTFVRAGQVIGLGVARAGVRVRTCILRCATRATRLIRPPP